MKREAEVGLRPLAVEFEAEIKAALNLDTWEDRAAALGVYGLAMRPYVGPNAKRQGIQIFAAASPNHACNGSDLGKNYGLGALNKRSAQAFADWFGAQEEREPTVQSPAAVKPGKEGDREERLHLKGLYSAYEEDHRSRRAARRALNAETRRRRRRVRSVIRSQRTALLDQGFEKTRARQICRVARRALENAIEKDHLSSVAGLSAYPPRKLTWAEWLTERAVDDPSAKRVYEAMRRRISKEDRASALAAAAAVKAQREADTKSLAAAAAVKQTRVDAATTKLRSLAGPASSGTIEKVVAASSALSPPVIDRPPPRPAAPARPSAPATSPPARTPAAGEPRPHSPPPPAPPVIHVQARSEATAPQAPLPSTDYQTQSIQKLDAMLDEAVKARWQIFRFADGYKLNKAYLESWPEGEQLERDPAHRKRLQDRLARMFGEQEKEVERVVEAIRLSKEIKLDPKTGYVLNESVSPDLQPMLYPRRWWQRITDAGKARVNDLAKAADPPEWLASEPAQREAAKPELAGGASVAAESKAEAASTKGPTIPSSQASAPQAALDRWSDRAEELTPADRLRHLKAALAETEPAADSGSPKAETVAAEPEVAAELTSPSTPLDVTPNADDVQSPSVASRDAFEAIMAEINEFGYQIRYDPHADRYELERPPQEWVAVLSAGHYAEVTARRLREMHQQRLELAELASSIQRAASIPGHAHVHGDAVIFPKFTAEQLALLDKHKANELVVELLGSIAADRKPAPGEPPTAVEAAWHAKLRDGGRG